MGKTAVLLAIAIIGYFLGIAIYFMLQNLVPYLATILPQFLQLGWVISGFVGAIFAVILVVIWSYTTKGD